MGVCGGLGDEGAVSRMQAIKGADYTDKALAGAKRNARRKVGRGSGQRARRRQATLPRASRPQPVGVPPRAESGQVGSCQAGAQEKGSPVMPALP